jgi:hypothetical protein
MKDCLHSDASEPEMFLSLAIIIQMGHFIQDRLTDYWAIMEQFTTHATATQSKTGSYTYLVSYPSQTTEIKLTMR